MSIYRHMECPICKNKLRTANSRKTNGGASTWRRKHCPNCDITLTSRETLDLSSLINIDEQSYSRLKLIAELSKISSKVSEDDISHTVDTIESRLLHLVRHNHKITKEIFMTEILAVLKKLDHSSYLRYMAQIQED